MNKFYKLRNLMILLIVLSISLLLANTPSKQLNSILGNTTDIIDSKDYKRTFTLDNYNT